MVNDIIKSDLLYGWDCETLERVWSCEHLEFGIIRKITEDEDDHKITNCILHIYPPLSLPLHIVIILIIHSSGVSQAK